MAVNLPEGMDSETLFRTVTAGQLNLKRVLGTLRTRGIDEGNILDFDVALDILWTFAVFGEGVDAGNAVDGLEDLLSCGNGLGKVFNPGSDLGERKGGKDYGEQTVHHQTNVQLAISNQPRSFPYQISPVKSSKRK
jgi:hypothetical protein